MDPDEALKRLREMALTILDGYWVDNDEFAETFAGLDTWLSTAGFLPLAWADEYMAQDKNGKPIRVRMPKAFDPSSRPI